MTELTQIVSTTPKNTLDIRFWPTDICNFNCEYCFPGSVLNINKFPKDAKLVVKNFRILLDEYQNSHGKTFFRINIAGGGEPALWPHLDYFCKEIKKHHNVQIKLTTNGSRKLEWFKEHTKNIDRFTMSCHYKEVPIDRFIKNCDYLWERGNQVSALVLMDAAHWQECIDCLEKLYASRYSWPIQAKEVVDAPGLDIDSYSQEQLNFLKQPLKRIPDGEWILENLDDLQIYESIAVYGNNDIKPVTPNYYISERENYFKGWKCSVPLENLVIAHDGKITGSCQEQIFKDANLSLFEDDFEDKFDRSKLDLQPIICPRNCCSCQPDTHVSKEKI